MFDIFITAINAVVPIVLLIILGYCLKKFNFLTQNFIQIGSKFIFKIGLPCMLFVNVYDKMESFTDIRWDVIIYCVSTICALFLFGVIVAVLITKNAKRRGVIVQSFFRSNFAIIGLVLVERLGGNLGLAGIVSAFSVPLLNVLGVIALTIFMSDEDTLVLLPTGEISNNRELNPTKTHKNHIIYSTMSNIIRNPLIIGVFVGLVFVGIREIERLACGGDVPFRFDKQLKFLYIAVRDIKDIASPLALIVLGGQFEFSAVKNMTKEIVVGTVGRVFLAPLIGIGMAILLSSMKVVSFDVDVYPTLIALFGTPTAVASAIMAGEMHNDEQLATQYVVWTSVCSVVTVFFTVFILMSFGLLIV